MFFVPERRAGLLVAAASMLACGAPGDEWSPPESTPSSSVTLLPPLDGPPPDCSSHPHLCGLPLVDLGGGGHPRAFQIVFVGDGFDIDDDFVGVVEGLHRGLIDDEGVGPVAFDPELFHFWRIDLESAAASSTIDEERRDTPLGAGLLPPDSCTGRPFITVDGPRLGLALDAATLAPDDTPPIDGPLSALRGVGLVHAVVVVAGSTGRANADLHVRMSSFDGVNTLRHELGHALFELADEYAEFDACPKGSLVDSARATDGDLVHRPNIQRSTHPAKWQGLSSSSVVGGERVPCLHHASDACLMAGTGDAFCPVCAVAMIERLDLQRCGEHDHEAPRVAIDAPLEAPDLVVLPGGSRAVVRAIVDDTRDGGLPVTWLLDGEVIAAVPVAELDLVELEQRARARGHALADAVLVARAVDRRGLVGESRPLLLDEALPGVLEVVPTSIGGLPGLVGVRVESLRPFDLIEVKSDVETIVVDSGPGGAATVAIRVPLAGAGEVQVSTRSPDGRLRSGDHRIQTSSSTPSPTSPAVEVAFADASDEAVLGARASLIVEVRACLAVLDVGVVIDGSRLQVERVAPRRGSACVEGQTPEVARYVVDVDGARESVRPIVIDVTGRQVTGPLLPVAPAGDEAEGCVVVAVGRPRSAFDAVAVVATPVGDGAGIVAASMVVGDRTIALRPDDRERSATFHPVDLGPGDRLRVAVTVRCGDGTLARVRRDIDTDELRAAVDLRPPLALAPLHAPGGGGPQDLIVVDDRELASVLVDGVEMLGGPGRPSTRLQVPPGARVEARDTAGLTTTIVVATPLPAPRVPSCG